MNKLLNQIFNEDCLDGMKRIPAGSVDMILCDLPYGVTQCKWDSVIPFEPLWEQYERVIKPNGAIVLTAAQPFTSALVMSKPKLFRYAWVWEKNRATGHLSAKRQPLRKHEDVLVFSKAPTPYFPQGTITGTFNSSRPAKGRGEGGAIYGGQRADFGISTIGNYPKSVIEFPVPHKPSHPTQKPVELFEYLVKTYTAEGETVLDNCMGSGTTAVACLNTGRSYIGFELDKAYFEIAQARIASTVPAWKEAA